MRAAFGKMGEVTRRLTTAAFGLWLAGAGCAFCCVGAAPAGHTQSDAATTAERGSPAGREISAPTHCPAHARPGRGAGPESASDAASFKATPPAGDHAGSCCKKVRQPSDPARKLRPSPERAAGHAPGEFSPMFVTVLSGGPPVARQRSPDGRATHVRCCVFLI